MIVPGRPRVSAAGHGDAAALAPAGDYGRGAGRRGGGRGRGDVAADCVPRAAQGRVLARVHPLARTQPRAALDRRPALARILWLPLAVAAGVVLRRRLQSKQDERLTPRARGMGPLPGRRDRICPRRRRGRARLPLSRPARLSAWSLNSLALATWLAAGKRSVQIGVAAILCVWLGGLTAGIVWLSRETLATHGQQRERGAREHVRNVRAFVATDDIDELLDKIGPRDLPYNNAWLLAELAAASVHPARAAGDRRGRRSTCSPPAAGSGFVAGHARRPRESAADVRLIRRWTGDEHRLVRESAAGLQQLSPPALRSRRRSPGWRSRPRRARRQWPRLESVAGAWHAPGVDQRLRPLPCRELLGRGVGSVAAVLDGLHAADRDCRRLDVRRRRRSSARRCLAMPRSPAAALRWRRLWRHDRHSGRRSLRSREGDEPAHVFFES